MIGPELVRLLLLRRRLIKRAFPSGYRVFSRLVPALLRYGDLSLLRMRPAAISLPRNLVGFGSMLGGGLGAGLTFYGIAKLLDRILGNQ